MRRTVHILLALSVCGVVASDALAQNRQERTEEATREEQRNRARLDREMQNSDLPLPELGNSGPCPYVKVLYDAARTIEFVGGRQASSAVAYSGEIQGLTATCRYRGDEPITVDMNVTFAIGRGPQATATTKEIGYWVAVTDRNKTVLAKEQYGFTADLSKSERVLVFERIANIKIPRATQRISGENYEVLVGFNVTPEMAAFNRKGMRFVVNATGQQAQTEPSQAAPAAR